ncbi:hypothetical protein ACSYAD_25780 [Acaryochloris marina NIES-2412]|uniref:hypothetical protein n=1 Tax=Acaryochloris marina TaxID=155978 RepID=UPI0040584805
MAQTIANIMTISKRIWQVILPPLFVIGMGILQIKFPQALDSISTSPRWQDLLDISQFMWGKIGGICTILLGLLALLDGGLSESKQFGQSHSPTLEVDTTKGEYSPSTNSHTSRTLQNGTPYLKQRQNGRQP